MHYRTRPMIGLLFALALLAPSQAQDTRRIDARDPASASQSFGAMIDALPLDKRRQVIEAVAVLNLRGVNTAQEFAARADLRNGFGIAGIKDEVSGLSADEIIALAREVRYIRIVRAD